MAPTIPNATVLDSIWLAGTDDYQQRVPRATQTNVTEVANRIFDPETPFVYNDFVSKLFTVLGNQIISAKPWSNPLSIFKRPAEIGQTIQEIGFKLIRAKGYSADFNNLFMTNRPEIKTAYYSENRRDRYDVTFNAQDLRRAFLSENGLADFLTGTLTALANSDQADEFAIMKHLFGEFSTAGMFAQTNLPAPLHDSTDAENKQFLKQCRALADKWRFISASFNKAGIPTFTAPDDLVLFVTPDVKANIDVNTFASLFNVSLAEANSRIVLIDAFPLSSTQAVLADKSLFVCADTVNQIREFENPASLNSNFYLHRWGIYAMSPFANAMEFTTAAASEPIVVTQAVEALTAKVVDNFGNDVSEIDRNGVFYLVTDLAGTIDPETPGVDVLPDSTTWVVVGPEGNQLRLNSVKFRIDRNGKITVGPDAENGNYTINVKSTYRDPATGSDGPSYSLTVQVA